MRLWLAAVPCLHMAAALPAVLSLMCASFMSQCSKTGTDMAQLAEAAERERAAAAERERAAAAASAAATATPAQAGEASKRPTSASSAGDMSFGGFLHCTMHYHDGCHGACMHVGVPSSPPCAIQFAVLMDACLLFLARSLCCRPVLAGAAADAALCGAAARRQSALTAAAGQLLHQPAGTAAQGARRMCSWVAGNRAVLHGWQHL